MVAQFCSLEVSPTQRDFTIESTVYTTPYHKATLNFAHHNFYINILCFNMEGVYYSVTEVNSYFANLNPKPELFVFLQGPQHLHVGIHKILDIEFRAVGTGQASQAMA